MLGVSCITFLYHYFSQKPVFTPGHFPVAACTNVKNLLELFEGKLKNYVPQIKNQVKNEKKLISRKILLKER